MAGVTAELKDNENEATRNSLASEDVIVLAPEAKDEAAATADQVQWIQTVMDRLKQLDLRGIKESEVGLAILNMSLEIYCNPRSSSGLWVG